MKLRRPRLVLAILAAGGAAIYFAAQNMVLRNLVHVIAYERVLDRYAQSDTTTTTVVSRVDAQGREASLLSAFFGLDDALPRMSGLVVCKGAGGMDGMPVVFSHEVDSGTIDPGDFRITTASGQPGAVTCLTMAPADDPGELRTALLVGQLGSIDDQPAMVEVVGNILSLDGSVNFKGARVAVTPLEAGPSLVWAERVAVDDGRLGATGTPIPWGGGTACPVGTRQIVRVTWNGGITKPGRGPVDDVERLLYTVTVVGSLGTHNEVTPFALADLSDGDNNHQLCLDTEAAATSVSFPAGYLVDPRGDPNPATAITIERGNTGDRSNPAPSNAAQP